MSIQDQILRKCREHYMGTGEGYPTVIRLGKKEMAALDKHFKQLESMGMTSGENPVKKKEFFGCQLIESLAESEIHVQ